MHLDGDGVAQAFGKARGERARLAGLLGVRAASESGRPTTTRPTSRSRDELAQARHAPLGGGLATASIGVTIVPVGSLSAQPHRALP